ncbi:hypothetical protein EDC96DRAFT_133836 [Choanephora cucurbitarum]|nr:hypothetical protein EDC96DRAFT_133836 [Choanephora cucurbitarum]
MERRSFFADLAARLQSPDLNVDLDRLLIMSYSNYSYQRPHIGVHSSLDWISFLDTYCLNALSLNDLHLVPTFRRNEISTSTIDYIFVCKLLHTSLVHTNLQLTNPAWTDHSLLSARLAIASTPTGPVLWRANPKYLHNPEYHKHLMTCIPTILQETRSQDQTPQQQWEFFKHRLKRVTRFFGARQANARKTKLNQLQSSRNSFLRIQPSAEERLRVLPSLEQKIAHLQKDIADNLVLRAGQRWREQGETLVRFLKGCVKQRQAGERSSALRDNIETVSSGDQFTIL